MCGYEAICHMVSMQERGEIAKTCRLEPNGLIAGI